MKDEFTSAMHEELTIDAETEIRHKAACVKKLLGSRYTQDQLERYCALYGITIEQYYAHFHTIKYNIFVQKPCVGVVVGASCGH